MNWKEEIINGIIDNLKRDPTWKKTAERIQNDNAMFSIHLAIFSEFLMGKLIAGEKKLESRFSSNLISPHQRIEKGDLIIVKKSGGPVSALFIAGDITYYQNLTSAKISELKNKYSAELGISIKDEFWKIKSESKYATFIVVDRVKKLPPFSIKKKDRTGWVVVKSKNDMTLF